MITIGQIFMRVDRVFRSRSDAARWRVTQLHTYIEVYRRPLLTNDVTLGALGIGTAAMPVPQLVCTIALSATQPGYVDVFVGGAPTDTQLYASVLPTQLLATIVPVIAEYA